MPDTETMEEALRSIVQWSEAYPLDIFPEPDWKKAAKLLKDGGMTLDAISASCMRHVIIDVGKLAASALETKPPPARKSPTIILAEEEQECRSSCPSQANENI